MTDSRTTTRQRQTTRQRHRAGAFDVRNFIAMLIGIYGAVLVVMGIFSTSDADLDKSGGLNINLWAGLGMLVVASAFVAWARLRPVLVPDEVDQTDQAGRDA